MKQKKIPELHRINAAILAAYTVITVILLFAYILEFAKGSRTPGYTLVFALLDLAPFIAYCILYRKDKTSPALKYILFKLCAEASMVVGNTFFIPMGEQPP